VRIGERHDGIVCTFDQPLHRRYGIVRGGLGSVDMELQRVQRRRQRELLCIGVCSRRTYTAINAEPKSFDEFASGMALHQRQQDHGR
jgi:hypothetical protein